MFFPFSLRPSNQIYLLPGPSPGRQYLPFFEEFTVSPVHDFPEHVTSVFFPSFVHDRYRYLEHFVLIQILVEHALSNFTF